MVAVSHMAEPAQLVLEIRDLKKTFGLVEVLKSISIEMADGDFLVLVGPSGCGKSTLLNCIAGLEETSGGKILIGGKDVTEVPPRDRDIAMVFQSYALYPTMSVAENIGFGMKVRKVPKPEQDKKIAEVAKLLQIEHLLERKPGALSGGQRQRVAMGRALVREPVLFLFDEPLSNLDAKLRVELRGEIKRLHERLRASIVYVTHDQIEAMTLGTRIVVLNQGVIQQIGTPAEIYERPANIFVADFMGSPPMNLVPAIHEGGRLHFTGGQSLVAPPALRPGDVIVGIRPEAFLPATGEGQLRLRAVSVEHAGSDTFAHVELGGKTITARLPGKIKVKTGDEVPLDVDLDAVCFFDPKSQLRLD
ncbi:ABC transporter ATP-binding protein [Devosia sp.]|jgi:multiple sugar transport system ATP-binding protein|uniref:ABC transporter ATP-binding protein n=1 Tax=Devosia sp. TaxID=1871048 RepID=UPI0037BEBEC2